MIDWVDWKWLTWKWRTFKIAGHEISGHEFVCIRRQFGPWTRVINRWFHLLITLVLSQLLGSLVLCLQNSWSCIKWQSVFSKFLKLDFGVRQGSILSPHLFAIYLDDLTDNSSFGQKPLLITYADDIILTLSSVGVLQKLLHECQQQLCWLGMSINVKKLCCLL